MHFYILVLKVFKYIKAFIALFKKRRYDALYIHGSSAIMSIELFAAKLMRCKVRVVHSHNTTCDFKKADKLLRFMFYHLYTDAFACGNEAGKWLYRKRPFTVISNGRDINKYKFDFEKRKEIRSILNEPDNELLVGHVGNFNYQKNQEFLVRVFKEFLKLKPNSKLYLMGSGDDYDNVKKLTEELSISDKVVFTGSIYNVSEMLQAMDVMVLPSRYEGVPLVAIEWQISGLPCLISDTVTTECAYTDFVKFKSLNDSFKAWAEEIAAMSHYSRSKNAEAALRLTGPCGFDINRNAAELQRFFIERCSSVKN